MRARKRVSQGLIILVLAGLGSASERTRASRIDGVEGQAGDVNHSFAVVRIKPSPDSEADDWGIGVRGRNFWAVHVTVQELIGWAYRVNARQIENAPEWFASERFDVDGLPDAATEPARAEYRTMLQAALRDRLSMKFHAGNKTLPVYVLSANGGGLKIPKAAEPGAQPSWGVHRGWLSIENMTFAEVAQVMQRTVFDRPVLDGTGLAGRYSFVLRWRSDETQFSQMRDVEVPEEAHTEDVDDIYTASRRQLGIRIEAKKTLAATMVIDEVSRPSAN